MHHSVQHRFTQTKPTRFVTYTDSSHYTGHGAGLNVWEAEPKTKTRLARVEVGEEEGEVAGRVQAAEE